MLKKHLNTKIKICFIFFLILLIGFVYKKIYDYQDYSPVIITENSHFNTKTPLNLYQNVSAQALFTAKHDHLGIIAMKFDTHWNINDDYLQFSIKEQGQSNWFYSAKYKVDQFNNYEYFPFGFPEIPNSKGKSYEIEIKSLYGQGNNYLTLSPFSDDFISKYNYSKKYLSENKSEIPSYLLNKSLSFINHLNFASWAYALLATLILYIFLNTRLGGNFVKYFQYSPKDNLPINQDNKGIFTFLTSIYALLFVTAAILLIKKHSESSEWLIYEISSILLFSFTLTLTFLKKNIAQKFFKKSLILGFFIFAVQLSYLIFFRHLLSYNYLIFLILSLVPTLIQLKQSPEQFLKNFLLQLIVLISVLSYFRLDIDNFSFPIVLVIMLSTLLLSQILKIVLTISSHKNILITSILFIISAVFALYSTNKPIDYHHYSFYLGPAYEISQDRSLLSDVPSQYGYLSIHFISSVLKPFGITFENFHILNQGIYILIYLLDFLIIYKITKNNYLSFLFSIITIFLQTQFSLDSNGLFPSSGPIRFGLGTLIIFFITYFPNKIGIIISAFIASISVFWSIETAIYIVPAYIFSLGAYSFINYSNFKNAFKIFLKYLSLFLVITLTIFGIIIFKEYQYHHISPPIKNYLQYATTYIDGFSSELIPDFGNYYLALIILISGFILFFEQIYNRKNELTTAFAFIIIHNVAIFSYFVSRSNQNNIVNISPFLLIEFCLILKILSQKIKNKNIYTLPISLFIVTFFYISYLNIKQPTRIHNSNQHNVYTQLTQYPIFQNKYNLTKISPLIISRDGDTALILKYQMKTYLPINPSLETVLLPNYDIKYFLPNLDKLQIGTTIVYSNDTPAIMEFIQKHFILKKIKTDPTDFFTLYTISAIAPPKDN
ncbi:MAG: hypothetical protein WC784_00350 [Candidatus Shapirobacteria bacterium]|jgi:hypothetical protein